MNASDAELPSTARLWLLPPFGVVILLLHLVVVWRMRAVGILEDPGTGWHLVTGRYILATLSIPTHDMYSYTAVGKEWISDYWLFEVLSAALQRIGGLPLYAAVCTLIYGMIPVVFRQEDERRCALIFGGLLALMILATLCNPVGLRLHLSILDQINPKSAGYFNEWVSPNFLEGGAAVRTFERLILALVLLLARR